MSAANALSGHKRTRANLRARISTVTPQLNMATARLARIEQDLLTALPHEKDDLLIEQGQVLTQVKNLTVQHKEIAKKIENVADMITIEQANVDRFDQREEDDKKFKKQIADQHEREEEVRTQQALATVKQVTKLRHEQ